MSEKHTPGPWVIGFDERLKDRAGEYIQIVDGAGHIGSNIVGFVCVNHPVNHELRSGGKANAALIAAAPDLLVVAKHAQEWTDPESVLGIRLAEVIQKAEGK